MNILEAGERSGVKLVEALQREFAAQGHNATFTASNSLYHTVELHPDKLDITVYGIGYLPFVNNGTAPGRYVPVGRLIEWAQVRRPDLDDKAVRSFAFAVRRKIYNEGTPTRNAYQYSSNGKRTEFAEDGLKSVIMEIEKDITEAFFKDIDEAMNKKQVA